MRRAGLLILLLALFAVPALAETCSRSTFASQDYAYARWCGDPAGVGTLRVARRDGRAVVYRDVPADTYRELIRTHAIGRYLATEVEARFRRVGSSDAARSVTQGARAAPVLPMPPLPPPQPSSRERERGAPTAR